jgi:hypothetical protein
VNVPALLALLLAVQAAPAGREDFEDEPFPNGLPEGWRRVEDDRHPSYNEARVETDSAARSGRQVLRLRSKGGSAAAEQLPKRAWPVQAGRPYRLVASARPAECRANAASITLVWRNQRFDSLGELTSAPLRGKRDWTDLALDLPPAPAGALWATVRLTFDGPDVSGVCDFDAVELRPAIRLDLRPSGRTLPLFETGLPLRFEVTVLGPAPGRHRVEADFRSAPLPALAVDSGTGGAVLDLPPAPPGVHRLRLSLPAAGLTREMTVLVADPRRGPSAPRAPFGLDLNPFEGDASAPGELLSWLGARHARVAIWDVPPPARGTPPDENELFEYVRRLSAGAPDRLEITGRLVRPPRGVVRDRDLETLEQYFREPRETWDPPLRAAVARFRELVPWWQAGDGPAQEPDAFLKSPGSRTFRMLHAPDVAGLLRALVEHAASGDPAAALVPAAPPLVDAAGRPSEGLLALRVANDLLAGASPRPPLLHPGAPVREAAFERDGRALVALWTDGPEVDREFQLGDGAALHPALGSARPLGASDRIRVGPMPVFVAGADVFFLESQTGLQVGGDGILPLRADPTTRTIRFRNLSKDQDLRDLRIRLQPGIPADWIVRPPSLSGGPLAPRQDFEGEMTFTLPPTETEREQELRFEVRFVQGGKEHVLKASRRLRLVSPVGVEPIFLAGRRLSFRVRSSSERPVTILLRLRIPGLPEIVEPVGALAPGREHLTPELALPPLDDVEPTRRTVEVLGEERGGERVQFRRVFPIP